jgi:flagellar assembly factor FliW
MLSIDTPRFGTVTFAQEEVIEFPTGLPGFEHEHEFLLVEPEASRPLCFLQSITTPALSFVCAPAALVQPGYEGSLSRMDREILVSPDPLQAPKNLEWLAILCFERPEQPTANLLGPVVLRRDLGLGLQSVREDSRYSARHPLFGEAASPKGAPCS